MRSRIAALLIAALLPAIGCAGRLYQTMTVPAAAGPDEVFTCVQDQLVKQQGFRRLQYDVTRRYFYATKVDPTEHRSDGLYRRTVTRLDVEVTAEATGTGLSIKVRTFDEMDSQRGPTAEERSATPNALKEAQELARVCGGPAKTGT